MTEGGSHFQPLILDHFFLMLASCSKRFKDHVNSWHRLKNTVWLLKVQNAPRSLEFSNSPTQYRRHAYSRAIDRFSTCMPIPLSLLKTPNAPKSLEFLNSRTFEQIRSPARVDHGLTPISRQL